VSKTQIRGIRTSSGESDVSIKIQGKELSMLASLANDVMTRVRDIPGVSNVEKSLEEAKPELRIRVDRERAAELGISIRDIGETVRTAIDGTIASRYTEGDREYDIRVLLDKSEVSGLGDVENLIIYPRFGPPTTLRSVARVKEGIGPVTITRENQNRIVEVTGDASGTNRSIGEIMQDVRTRLGEISLPDGYSIIYGGQEETIAENNRNLLVIISLAIFLVYVVMAVQYESLLNPFVILTTIPLSLMGVIGSLLITQTAIGATVMLGVILLAGIVVNNSIVFVEYIEILRREKSLSVREAILAAGPLRLRPIVMTTLTTVVGMLPLAMGLGEGSEVLQPLAIATIGGLLVSTLVSLGVIPLVYSVMHEVRDKLLVPRAVKERERKSEAVAMEHAVAVRDGE